jgi:hypothetical protein
LTATPVRQLPAAHDRLPAVRGNRLPIRRRSSALQLLLLRRPSPSERYTAAQYNRIMRRLAAIGATLLLAAAGALAAARSWAPTNIRLMTAIAAAGAIACGLIVGAGVTWRRPAPSDTPTQ